MNQSNALMIQERRDTRLLGKMKRKGEVHMAEPVISREDVELLTENRMLKSCMETARMREYQAARNVARIRRRMRAMIRSAAGCAIILCVVLTTVFGAVGMPWWACVIPTAVAALTAKAVGWL